MLRRATIIDKWTENYKMKMVFSQTIVSNQGCRFEIREVWYGEKASLGWNCTERLFRYGPRDCPRGG